MSVYIGVNNTAKKVKNIFVGENNIAKQVKSIVVNDNYVFKQNNGTAIGITWGTAENAGWNRVNDDGTDYTDVVKISGNKIDVSNMFPFNQMEQRTVDGQDMVYIPKIYVKNVSSLEDGPYKGRPAYYISDKKLDGYHVHPAFMYNGQECSGIEIGAWLAGKESNIATSKQGVSPWNNITRDQAITNALTRNTAGTTTGWHMYNIWEHHLIARLMLIEGGRGDTQTVFGGSSTAVSVNYHGIRDVWGGTTFNSGMPHFWLDGFDTLGSSNHIRVKNPNGNGQWVDTGIAPARYLYPFGNVLRNKTASYDMGDLFIANAEGSVIPDYQSFYGGCVFCVYGYAVADGGAFFLHYNSSSGADSSIGFRLARYCV